MFGKFFASTFTGSMVGAGPEMFAVWGYVVANTVGSQVELNPRHLASLIGMTPDAVAKCIERLCEPDPHSRSKKHNGRRLIREGEFAYFVPNHEAYRAVRDEHDRREYNRVKKAESRARLAKRVKMPVNASIRESTMSAQAEAEAEAEAEKETSNTSAAHNEREDFNHLMGVIRETFWIPDGTPPKGWDDKREADVLAMFLKGKRKFSPDALEQAIRGVRLLADCPGRYGDAVDWLSPGCKLTLRVLLKKSGVHDVLTLATQAYWKHANTGASNGSVPQRLKVVAP